jgi:hypothetical protein
MIFGIEHLKKKKPIKSLTSEQFDRLFFLLQSKENDKGNKHSFWVGNSTARIYKEEFMRIFEVYELWKYESKFS